MKSDAFGFIGRTVAACASHGVATLVVVAMLTALAAGYSAEQFRMNSNLGALIKQEGGWREDFERFKASFPMLVDTAIVVVTAPSQSSLESSTRALEEAFRARAKLEDIYAPANDPFFRDHALLYLDRAALEAMVDRLARAQPMLTAVAEDPSLRGVLELVQDGVEHEPTAGFARIVELLDTAAAGVLRGEPATVRWTDEFFESDGALLRVVYLKGRADFGAALPNAVVMAEIREAIAATPLDPGVEVLVTGEIALAHEEIRAAQQGVALAGTVSLVLLTAILVLGIRSARIVTVLFLLLAVGVSLTTAWALLAVGEFNTLSLVFLAMFFGVGVDFSVHYCLRYEEALAAGQESRAALRRAADDVGGAIVLCALTTAIGFLGFVPTDYGGLGDLGIISAGGVVIATVLTFTLVPAFFAVFGPPRRRRTVELPTAAGWVRRLVGARRAVLSIVVVATVAAAIVGSRVYFDYSVLALRDDSSESMRALALLNRENVVNDYSLSVLGHAADGDDALRAAARLPVVAEVRNPVDYLPDEQDAKLDVLADVALLLDSALTPARRREAPDAAERTAAVDALLASLASESPPNRVLAERLDGFAARLRDLTGRGPDALLAFEHAVVANLREELDWLGRAVAVDRPVAFEDLPAPLRTRLVSASGEYLSQVLPQEDLSRVENLAQFVEDVRAVAPNATGRPAIEWGVGNIVQRSFFEALGFALLAIVVILLVALESVRETLLVLLPLALTAVFTVAAQVLFDVPFNMANVLVLPLIFGLGVDGGIHVVDRYRRGGDVANLMHSSTPRAVLLSTLTTVATFAALILSAHRGTASIGILLTVSMLLLLFFTTIVLPVLLGAPSRTSPTP
jgi:hypothetical protein